MSFSMYFLSGVQQNDTSRVISPTEKPLPQAEPFNSHHKTKKLRPDESLSGGLIILLQNRFIPSISYVFIQAGSPKACLSDSSVSFSLYRSQPGILSFPAPSAASPSGMWNEGVSASGPRKAAQRKAPGTGGLKASGAAFLPASRLNPPPSCVSSFCCLNLLGSLTSS